jgi:heme/copper-type cytochrome/quinol oxidase subunit 2
VIEPASSNIWLAIGLPIIGLMLVVSFAAVYLLKKCKKMKGKARKENEDTQLEEIMTINNS